MPLHHTKQVSIFAPKIKHFYKMNIILADNQELTALGLINLLKHINNEDVVCVANQMQLINTIVTKGCHIVVLDYALFDFKSEAEFLLMAEFYKKTQWILLSDKLPVPFIRQIIEQTDNVSILFKDSPINELTNAVHSVKDGFRFIGQHVTNLVLSHQLKLNKSQELTLTPTELAILEEMSLGLTTKQIASNRSLSAHTVSSHRKNIFRKLEVNTAHEAIKYAVQAGLIDAGKIYK